MIELAIENLPEQCQRVFKMSRYEHLSYNEIAERHGISAHTVQFHISEVLSRL